MTRAWVNNFSNPVAIARVLLSNASALVRSAFAELRSDDDDEEIVVPDTVLNAPVSAHRVIDYAGCSLADLKRVRRAVEGSTINDVCLTVVAEAMRRYLDAKGKLPADSLYTTVPISTRTPEQAKAGGNQISVTRVSLRTDIVDPLERLAAIAEETRKKKAMQDGVVMSVLLDVVHKLPGLLIGVAARAASLAAANSKAISNTMVTNVPGPLEPLYFLGAKAVHMFGSPPLMDGAGVLHSVGSYNGEFMFCFTACRDLVPDPDFYRDCLSAGARAVIKAADKQEARARSPRRGSRRRAASS